MPTISPSRPQLALPPPLPLLDGGMVCGLWTTSSLVVGVGRLFVGVCANCENCELRVLPTDGWRQATRHARGCVTARGGATRAACGTLPVAGWTCHATPAAPRHVRVPTRGRLLGLHALSLLWGYACFGEEGRDECARTREVGAGPGVRRRAHAQGAARPGPL